MEFEYGRGSGSRCCRCVFAKFSGSRPFRWRAGRKRIRQNGDLQPAVAEAVFAGVEFWGAGREVTNKVQKTRKDVLRSASGHADRAGDGAFGAALGRDAGLRMRVGLVVDGQKYPAGV